jgi:amidase
MENKVRVLLQIEGKQKTHIPTTMKFYLSGDVRNSMKTYKELLNGFGGKSEILNKQQRCECGEGGALTWLGQTHRSITAMDQAGIRLNAVLEWNLEAEGIACALNHEYMKTGWRSPLHGIPILLKDNIDTGDCMHTSAGSLALAERYASQDAFIVSKLRAAGAVICGKTNMTEFANFMTDNMPNGYSSRGGQVKHVWKVDADPSGSSTGSAVAVAAGYVPLAIGTETCGSIISPAAAAGIVGLKPTVGWVSRKGIIPIAPSQDVAGPMARTVADCALAFEVIAGYDPADPATGLCIDRQLPKPEDFQKYSNGLKGVRIGVFMLDEEDKPVKYPAFHNALHVLESLGAELVPFSPPPGAGKHMGTVLLHEFRPAMDTALKDSKGPIHSLAGISTFNEAHAEECLRYGQTNITKALSLPKPMLTSEYFEARETAGSALRALQKSFSELALDAVVSLYGLMVFPVTGCPALTLPVGVDDEEGMPVPVVINGLPFTEGNILGIGMALETALNLSLQPALIKMAKENEADKMKG